MLLISLILIISIDINNFFNFFGEFTYYFSVVASVILFSMLFMKEEVFNVWKGFAPLFILSSILISGILPSDGNFFDLREISIHALSLTFFISSVFITKYYSKKFNFWIIIPVSFILSLILLFIITRIW